VLPALLGFLAGVAALAASVRTPRLATAVIASTLTVSLWADAQWFTQPLYRKNDCRAVAQWLVQHHDRLQSWTVLPGYLGKAVQWHLAGQPEVLARELPASEELTTTFPPVPAVLIIGRRHHVQKPDQIIAAYRALVGELTTNRSFAGFELYYPAR
jgi:hypothetical protein